jgi:hypothetical protein
MNISSNMLDEAEDIRQQRLEQIVTECGQDWSERYRPGTTGCHELLDRTANVADSLERLIVEHPACVRNREWHALACQAAEALHELYQRVGAEHLSSPS